MGAAKLAVVSPGAPGADTIRPVGFAARNAGLLHRAPDTRALFSI